MPGRESRDASARGAGRLALGAAMLVVLGLAYAGEARGGDAGLLNFFGYFTNQTSLWAALILSLTGALMLSRRRVPRWLSTARGVSVACQIVVALVYNLLVPGTGSAPAWISALLHAVFPVLVLLDWGFDRGRVAQPWSRIWWVLPYPLIWLGVVLLRGVTDGWVPYGFLLPERGLPALVTHVAGMLVALLCAAALVWWLSRPRHRRILPA